ncbi:shikimate dehydrogenase [Fusobacterium sp.]|uniref:shikimate dehydrogenase n=1 Tax=Fusobacterium sp. TaxID=68766 RepID=UPI00396CF23F
MTKLGLVGEKLGHSLSPEIHNFIFKNNNIHGNYSLIEIKKEDSDKIVEIARKIGLSGFNVTVPYKETVMEQLDFISEEALAIGAVNTVIVEKDRVSGYNTDYYGIIKLFSQLGTDLKDKKFCILGSGGAAKALIVAIHNLGGKVSVVSRNKYSKGDLKIRFPYIDLLSYDEIDGGEVVINATPVGMYPDIHKTPLDEKNIKKFKFAVDIIYNPYTTEFLQIAKKNGLITINGLPMLVEQGIKAQELWQNKKFDNVLYSELLELLGGKNENNGD